MLIYWGWLDWVYVNLDLVYFMYDVFEFFVPLGYLSRVLLVVYVDYGCYGWFCLLVVFWPLWRSYVHEGVGVGLSV